jgi:hypothetical protein
LREFKVHSSCPLGYYHMPWLISILGEYLSRKIVE